MWISPEYKTAAKEQFSPGCSITCKTWAAQFAIVAQLETDTHEVGVCAGLHKMTGAAGAARRAIRARLLAQQCRGEQGGKFALAETCRTAK